MIEVKFAEQSQLREIYEFERCTGLTEIHIPKSTAAIASSAFCACRALRRIALVEETQ